MDKLTAGFIARSKPEFVPVEAAAPRTVSSIRSWTEGSFSIWLLGPPNQDESLNIVYEVGQAQN